MNSKTLYLTKKYSYIKWAEIKAKNIKWEHTISVFGDKRIVLNDGVDTLAYFHNDLKK